MESRTMTRSKAASGSTRALKESRKNSGCHRVRPAAADGERHPMRAATRAEIQAAPAHRTTVNSLTAPNPT
jgi:hypothetical protein